MKGSTVNKDVNDALWTRCGQHIAIAAAYAAVYEVVRHVTFPHWSPTTGLRLACLLLIPLRYWPALALGEALPTMENAWLCAADLGVPWAVSASVPMIVPFMACMKPLRLRWSLYDDRGQLRMPLLLGATLTCALISATLSCTTLLTTILRTPDAWPHLSIKNMFWAYTLGHFLGGLTLTPTILALTERARRLRRVTWAAIWHSPLLRDVLLWIPVLTALVGLAATTEDDTVRQFARLGVIWPAIALAWRHGWHGAAPILSRQCWVARRTLRQIPTAWRPGSGATHRNHIRAAQRFFHFSLERIGRRVPPIPSVRPRQECRWWVPVMDLSEYAID